MPETDVDDDFKHIVEKIKEKIVGLSLVYFKISLLDLITKTKLEEHVEKHNDPTLWEKYCPEYIPKEEIDLVLLMIAMLEELIMDRQIYGHIDGDFLLIEY